MKSTTIFIILVSMFIGMCVGCCFERNYTIKHAELLEVTESGYKIGFGQLEDYEVHEYTFD